MNSLLMFWLFLLTVWVVIKEFGLIGKFIPSMKPSLMDTAEMDWVPEKVRSNWNKKVIKELIPVVKVGLMSNDTVISMMNNSIDTSLKDVKSGNFINMIGQTPDTTTTNTARTGVSGYSVRK